MQELNFDDLDDIVNEISKKGNYSDIDVMFEKKMQQSQAQDGRGGGDMGELDLAEFGNKELMKEIEKNDAEEIGWADVDGEALKNETLAFDIYKAQPDLKSDKKKSGLFEIGRKNKVGE